MRGPDTIVRVVASAIAGATDRFVPKGGLGERAAKSGAWVAGMNVADRVLKLAMLVVVARVLGPRAIGLLGIALLTVSALRSLTNVGIRQALIQKVEDDVDRYLDTAFSIELLRGLCLATATWLLAPSVGRLFGEPGAVWLIRVVGLSFLVLGVRNPGMVYFQKDLAFHREFAYRIAGTLALITFAIVGAVVYGTIWGLVVGYVADATVRTATTYVLHPYRPRPRLDRKQAADLIGFGKWIMASQLLRFLQSEGDDAVVGWVLTAASLGFYQIAYRLSNAPATEISNVIGQVMFPTYSKLQTDLSRLRDAYRRTLRLTTFVSFPMAVGIVATAPTFVEGYLGAEWLPMVLPMQILVVYGLLRAVLATFEPVWKAIGRPDLVAKLRAVQVAVLAVAVVPVTARYGIVGTAALVTGIALFPMVPLNAYVLARTVDASPRRILADLRYPAAASLTMGLVVLGLREAVTVPSWVAFPLLVVAGLATYAGVVAALVVAFDWEIHRTIHTAVGLLRS